MSTMTLRKRIALVAVAALGAGVLSVAPANAAAGDLTLTAGVSAGLAASDLTGSTTKTAVLLSTGRLGLTIEHDDTAKARVEVSAGAIIVSGTNATISGTQLKADSTAAGTDLQVVIAPTGAVGSTFTVKSYADATTTTVKNQITVTVAGSSVAGVMSPADSTIAFVAADGDAATTDVANENSTTVGTALFLNIQLQDAYGVDITTPGALVATVSSGAYVAVATSAGGTAGTAGTFTSAVSGLNPADLNISVTEATVGAGWNGTITVTFNGVVVGTKSGVITGAPSAITITPKKVGKNDGNATAAAFDYTVADRAGNALVLPFADLVFSSSSASTVVSAAAGSVVNTTTAAGKGTITCVSGAVGSSSVVVQTVLSNGSIVKSNAATFRCGGAAASYTASWDKASYVQGEIAKLTVSFKDAKGSAANSTDTVTTWVSATDLGRTITAPMMTVVDATPTASETVDVNGNIVYTFTVGTTTGLTEGSYSAIVSFPKQSLVANQTATYKVTTGSTGTSNADVLKAIVSLIASINKQIAALQKALLRR
jgi:hypothetical protein